jgi:phosphohistidine phosphatase
MEVYLVQHGEAVPESQDPERPLADRGRAEVDSVARHVANAGTKVSQIRHSGKLRARQTAEVFAQHLAPPGGMAEQKGLGPNDDPEKALRQVSEAEEPLMIVGHLPHLSRLASLLLLGDPEKAAVAFRMGGVVCLGRTDRGWSLKWALVPEIVPQ